MADFSKLGDILKGAMQRVTASDEARAYQGWGRVAGDDVLAVTTPRRFARGVLTIECESSAWANELTYLSPVIIDRLKEDDPDTPVERLRFTAGSRRPRS